MFAKFSNKIKSYLLLNILFIYNASTFAIEGFLENTLVCVAPGEFKEINQLSKGDTVLSIDLENFRLVQDKVIEIAAECEDGFFYSSFIGISFQSSSETIYCGKDQRFFCANTGKWIKATNLSKKNRFLASPIPIDVNEINKINYSEDFTPTFYRITLENNPHFFITKNFILVHNAELYRDPYTISFFQNAGGILFFLATAHPIVKTVCAGLVIGNIVYDMFHMMDPETRSQLCERIAKGVRRQYYEGKDYSKKVDSPELKEKIKTYQKKALDKYDSLNKEEYIYDSSTYDQSKFIKPSKKIVTPKVQSFEEALKEKQIFNEMEFELLNNNLEDFTFELPVKEETYSSKISLIGKEEAVAKLIDNLIEDPNFAVTLEEEALIQEFFRQLGKRKLLPKKEESKEEHKEEYHGCGEATLKKPESTICFPPDSKVVVEPTGFTPGFALPEPPGFTPFFSKPGTTTCFPPDSKVIMEPTGFTPSDTKTEPTICFPLDDPLIKDKFISCFENIEFPSFISQEGHIFSKAHIKDGIEDLGKNREEIYDEICDKIKQANSKGLLQAGSNQIRTFINGHQTEIRLYLVNGEILKIDAFKGISSRDINNVVNIP